MTTPNVKAALEAAIVPLGALMVERVTLEKYLSAEVGAAVADAFLKCKAALASLASPEVERVLVTDEQVERAAMVLLGKMEDPSPGVDWLCHRQWTVNQVRDLMRSALRAAALATPAAKPDAPGGELHTREAAGFCPGCGAGGCDLYAPPPSPPETTRESTATTMDFDAVARSWFKWAGGRDDDLILRSVADLLRQTFATGQRARAAELAELKERHASELEGLGSRLKELRAELAKVRAEMATMVPREWLESERHTRAEQAARADTAEENGRRHAKAAAKFEEDAATLIQTLTAARDAAEARATEAERLLSVERQHVAALQEGRDAAESQLAAERRRVEEALSALKNIKLDGESDDGRYIISTVTRILTKKE